METKLQNYFKDFLPMKYSEFKRGINNLPSNPAVVAELLRIGCEETAANGGVRAIQMAFERVLGKPEKVVVIKRTMVRTVYLDAKEKLLSPPEIEETDEDEMEYINPLTHNKTIVEASDAPSYMLRAELDKIGEKGRNYAYAVKDNPRGHTVAEVLVCSLYALAMAGGNLAAIDMLFNYLDGAVADVIRIDGGDTILLENYAEIAPYEAIKGEDGVFYVEKVGVA